MSTIAQLSSKEHLNKTINNPIEVFTAFEYLKINVANTFGLDKLSWRDRIDWFDTNEKNLPSMISQADEPAQFLATLQAIKDVRNGDPTGLPISLDATSSGLQLLATMTGDTQSAALCNLINTGEREDAYTIIYDYMVQTYNLPGNISRDNVKKAIMTSLYGSIKEPREVFGNILNQFFETMQTVAPGVWQINQFLLDIWDNTRSVYEWTYPDNFHLVNKVMDKVTKGFFFLDEPQEVEYRTNQPIEKGRSLCAHLTHGTDGLVVRELVTRCNYDRKRLDLVNDFLDDKLVDLVPVESNTRLALSIHNHYVRTGFLSARILNCVDYNTIHLFDPNDIRDLLESIPDRAFPILPVHDRFGVHPNHGNSIRQQYNLVLSKIGESNLLSDIISQIMGKEVNIGKMDDSLSKYILNANYSLS